VTLAQMRLPGAMVKAVIGVCSWEGSPTREVVGGPVVVGLLRPRLDQVSGMVTPSMRSTWTSRCCPALLDTDGTVQQPVTAEYVPDCTT